MHTGEVIREFREKAGFSQKMLAKALHITDKAVSKWERGYSLPDISLLPKLAFLLDVDIDLLLTKSLEQEEWVGYIEIEDCDLSQVVYDKPLVDYLLTHFLLLGITSIYITTSEQNRAFLESRELDRLGLKILFNRPEETNVMLITRPWFLFGSDLTEQFQGAMLSKRLIKVVPLNQEPVFFFIPAEQLSMYFDDKKRFNRKLNTRNLGRGMVCLDMSDHDGALDVASFVRTYQNNSGFLIGSLEEVAYRKELISREQLEKLAQQAPYGDLLKKVNQ